MLPVKYALYPAGQLSIARTDAHQYIANVTLPLTTQIRQDIENYLTSLNRRMKKPSLKNKMIKIIFLEYGLAKIVYAEPLNAFQTRFYLVVRMSSYF